MPRLSQVSNAPKEACKRMLGSFPPAKGTKYFTCDNSFCRRRIPLQVRKPSGFLSRVGSCPYCNRRRPLTDDEQELISGNESNGTKSTINLICKLARRFSIKYSIDYDEIIGDAYDAACFAAATFEPVNGFAFSTHCTVHIKGRLNRRLADRFRPLGRANVRLFCDMETDESRRIDPASDDTRKDEQDEAKHILAELMAVSSMTRRERFAVASYFGICGNNQLTSKQLGRRFRVSRQRVITIKQNGIKRLRDQAESMGIA